jgi:hypothetical protein
MRHKVRCHSGARSLWIFYYSIYRRLSAAAAEAGFRQCDVTAALKALRRPKSTKMLPSDYGEL